MNNQNLQLLVKGSGVGNTLPVISYPGITIKKATRGDSENYLFIDLAIAKNAKPGTVLISCQKDNKTVYIYNYLLLARQMAKHCILRPLMVFTPISGAAKKNLCWL